MTPPLTKSDLLEIFLSIVKTLLELDSEHYTTLTTRIEGPQSKHPIYFKDDSGWNSFYLAIEDGQFDICHLMLDMVDRSTLKTIPIIGGKKALKFVNEELENPEKVDSHTELNELKTSIKNKLK